MKEDDNMVKTRVKVRLTGTDGNAFAIMSKVRRALKKGGVDRSVIEQYTEEAMSGDYDHLLQTTIKYVIVS